MIYMSIIQVKKNYKKNKQEYAQFIPHKKKENQS